MTETWCATLNILILSIVSGANAVLISRTRGLPAATNRRRTGSNENEGEA